MAWRLGVGGCGGRSLVLLVCRVGDDSGSEVGGMCRWEYMYAVVVAVVAMIKSKKWMYVSFLVRCRVNSLYL